jgi:hypothetical protein
VVRNNLASRVWVYNLDSGVEADHNVAMLGSGPELSWYLNDVPQYYGKAGTYANNNIINSEETASEFVNFNPARLTYNLMLKSVAQAIGAGTATGTPTLDILGATRTAPTAVRAYAFPY